jgi:DNA-binding PadR family transcriptional regulator
MARLTASFSWVRSSVFHSNLPLNPGRAPRPEGQKIFDDISIVDISILDMPSTEKLSPAALEILLILAGQSMHGYAIMKTSRGEGGVRLGPGTLYRWLDSLSQTGYIRIKKEDGRRNLYEITPSGRKVLRDELSHAQNLLARAKVAGIRTQGSGG